MHIDPHCLRMADEALHPIRHVWTDWMDHETYQRNNARCDSWLCQIPGPSKAMCRVSSCTGPPKTEGSQIDSVKAHSSIRTVGQWSRVAHWLAHPGFLPRLFFSFLYLKKTKFQKYMPNRKIFKKWVSVAPLMGDRGPVAHPIGDRS